MNTERNARIIVRGTQVADGEQPQTIELVTDGTFTVAEDAYVIHYTESAMTDMPGVETTFRVESDQIVLTRSGGIESEMVFRPGERTESLYDVGVGAMLLSVSTKRVSIEMNADGGTCEFDYNVELEHTPVTRNNYHVTVEPR